jgi:hypothetical protein
MSDLAPSDVYRQIGEDGLRHIGLMAGAASGHILVHGWAAVRLTPGDMTMYRIIIAPNEEMAASPDGGVVWDVINAGWVVACADGSYPWTGHHVDPSYVASKWTRGHLWTAVIIAEFLNRLGRYLLEERA